MITRQYDLALDFTRKALELDANHSLAHVFVGEAYVQKGMFEQGIAELERARTVIGDDQDEIAMIGDAYGMWGKKDEARKRLEELNERAKQRWTSAFTRAIVHVGLGQKDRAFEWLDNAYQERDSWLVYVKPWPPFDSIRSDPRYLDLLRRVGLPP